MSRTLRSRPSRAATGVVTALVALLVAGCGAGQLTATSTQRSSAGGANGAAGSVVVRDAQIEFGEDVPAAVVYPVGATAPLEMYIANEGAAADRLVSASSPVASSVQVSGTTTLPGGQALAVGSTAAPVPGTSAAQVMLVGLTQDVRAGLTYPVVLRFERAGPIPLDVPVDNPTTAREPATE